MSPTSQRQPGGSAGRAPAGSAAALDRRSRAHTRRWLGAAGSAPGGRTSVSAPAQRHRGRPRARWLQLPGRGHQSPDRTPLGPNARGGPGLYVSPEVPVPRQADGLRDRYSVRRDRPGPEFEREVWHFPTGHPGRGPRELRGCRCAAAPGAPRRDCAHALSARRGWSAVLCPRAWLAARQFRRGDTRIGAGPTGACDRRDPPGAPVAPAVRARGRARGGQRHRLRHARGHHWPRGRRQSRRDIQPYLSLQATRLSWAPVARGLGRAPSPPRTPRLL